MHAGIHACIHAPVMPRSSHSHHSPFGVALSFNTRNTCPALKASSVIAVNASPCGVKARCASDVTESLIHRSHAPRGSEASLSYRATAYSSS